MAEQKNKSDQQDLEIKYCVPAKPARVFAAWTNPDELRQWWGPKGVRCVSAHIDLRVGGQYRIGNELPGGDVLWIEGVFDVIEIPNLLEYTWSTNPASDYQERVLVKFEPIEAGTEITIRHRRIATAAIREDHELGWLGCLDGLRSFLQDHGH